MIEEIQTMTRYYVRHSSHTAYIRKKVAECKPKLEAIEGSEDVQRVLLYKKTIKDTLKDQSLTLWECFLENLSLVYRAATPDLYSIFKFEPHHNLHYSDINCKKQCFYWSAAILERMSKIKMFRFVDAEQ